MSFDEDILAFFGWRLFWLLFEKMGEFFESSGHTDFAGLKRACRVYFYLLSMMKLHWMILAVLYVVYLSFYVFPHEKDLKRNKKKHLFGRKKFF
jgi:hypothetical protein